MNTKLIAILAIATLSIALPSTVYAGESFADFCKRKSGGSISAADFICTWDLEQMYTDLKKNTLEIENMRSVKMVKMIEYVELNAGDELLVQNEIQYYTVACPGNFVIQGLSYKGYDNIGLLGIFEISPDSTFATYQFQKVEEDGYVTITMLCEGLSYP